MLLPGITLAMLAMQPPNSVVIAGFAFRPASLTVRLGATVTWTNQDSIEHTATSQTGPGTLVPSGVFDSGPLGLGATFSHTFESAGEFHYFCLPHGSSMQGVIRVERCPADLSGSADPADPTYGRPDGMIDAADFFYFLDQFAEGNRDVADLTGSADPNDGGYGVPDRLVDAGDFFYYLDLFVAPCS